MAVAAVPENALFRGDIPPAPPIAPTPPPNPAKSRPEGVPALEAPVTKLAPAELVAEAAFVPAPTPKSEADEPLFGDPPLACENATGAKPAAFVPAPTPKVVLVDPRQGATAMMLPLPNWSM